MALTSPTSGGRLVGIVRWQTKAPEFVLFVSPKKVFSRVVLSSLFTLNDFSGVSIFNIAV
jgi:hypothetical protein